LRVEGKDLIIFENPIVRSLIWNNTWKQCNLVHKNIFWEVKYGTSTLFWEDSWKYNKKLEEYQPLQIAQLTFKDAKFHLIKYYCLSTPCHKKDNHIFFDIARSEESHVWRKSQNKIKLKIKKKLGH
jgi:hypothetical protein